MSLVTAIVILAVSAGIAIGIVIATRWLVRIGLGLGNTSDGVLRFIGGLYGLTVGFVLVISMQSYKDAEVAARAEANALRSLSRAAVAFEPIFRDNIGHQLVCYGRFVVDDEWISMKSGQESELVSEAADQLSNSLGNVAADGGYAPSVVAFSLEQSRMLLESRNKRLFAASTQLPKVFWLFLIGGAITIIVLTSILISNQHFPSHIVLVLAMTIFVVAALSLVRIFEQPFGGGIGSIDSRAMEVAVESAVDFAPDPAVDRPCPN